MQPYEKERIVQLINGWRERSNLSVKQIVARIQTQGCNISRSMFENRFIRYDQLPDVAPELTLAVIVAFTEGLTPTERCTAAEAIELAQLTHLPIDQFSAMQTSFPEGEFQQAFRRHLPDGVELTSFAAARVTEKSALPRPVHLPGKSYHRLVGRTRELAQLAEVLCESDRKPIIAVTGLGGIGKTTLAQEAIEYCWRERQFDYIVWASTKTERFIGEGIHKTEVSVFSFDRLLDEIGRQCDRRELSKLPFLEKQMAVKQFLLTRRVLIVLDNLETVPNSEALVEEVFQILGCGKLLITSRHQVRHDRAYNLDLSGLYEAEGITFLREDSFERGIEVVAQASQADLAAIHRVTGGAPLAMKLVIGQASRWPLDQVLNNLKAAHAAGPNYELYRFIYKHSWDLLDLATQKVLVSMSVFDPANGSTERALQQVSQVELAAMQKALDQLIILSLVEVLGDLTARRYTLHALTHYFVMSDIVKKWS